MTVSLYYSVFILFGLFFTKVRSNSEEQICDSNGVCVAKADPIISRFANQDGRPPEVDLSQCHDRHESCQVFFNQGECENNPGWMIVNCPVSCSACHLLDRKIRCDRKFLNISLEPAYQPGEMSKMFESIPIKYANLGVTVLSQDPWIVTFDNFMDDEEISSLLKTASDNGKKWERSTDTGAVNAFGETGRVLSQSRTSSNAWCRHECESHPAVKRLSQRIETIINVPFVNAESFQVLKYEKGQKYGAHHDMSPAQVALTCGPRILTFFLYLSDVEEGGETAFPSLGISVKPKKGKALLWPSVLDSNLEMVDSRTTHEAKPVIKGVKFAANSWIHLYDFSKSNLWGCTGTFD